MNVGDAVSLPHIPGDRFIVGHMANDRIWVYREDDPELGLICWHTGQGEVLMEAGGVPRDEAARNYCMEKPDGAPRLFLQELYAEIIQARRMPYTPGEKLRLLRERAW